MHLRDVFAEIIENLLRRGRYVPGIGFQGVAEGGDIVESQLAGDDEHLALNAVDLTQADRVNLFGSQGTDGRAAANVVEIALLSAGQRSDAQCTSTQRCVLGDRKST